MLQSLLRSATLCAEPPPERVLLHEVRERPFAVDLDDRQPLAVARLEDGVAADVDRLELEAELRAEGGQLRERPLAEMAALGVVDDDFRDRAPS